MIRLYNASGDTGVNTDVMMKCRRLALSITKGREGRIAMVDNLYIIWQCYLIGSRTKEDPKHNLVLPSGDRTSRILLDHLWLRILA